jgi:hypothetical protein
MVKKYKQRKDKVLNCIYNFEIGGLSCLPWKIVLVVAEQTQWTRTNLASKF